MRPEQSKTYEIGPKKLKSTNEKFLVKINGTGLTASKLTEYAVVVTEYSNGVSFNSKT